MKTTSAGCAKQRWRTNLLFMCQKLIENCESLAENTQVEYEDIFGTTNKQLKAMALFEKIHETRDKLIYENNL